MNEDNISQTTNSDNTQISVDELFNEALEKFNNNSLTKADQLCTAIIQAIPDHVYAINLLGLIGQRINRHDLAIPQFQKAINIDGGNPLFYYNLAISFYKSRNIDGAIAAQKQALSLKPDYFEAHNSLAQIYIDKRDFDHAIKSLNQALAIKPDYLFAHYNHALVMAEQGELEKAVASYQKAISIDPNFVDAHNNLAIVFQKQNRLDDAVAFFKKAVLIKPDFADAHSNLGGAQQELGRFVEAIHSCQTAISLNPNHAEAYCNLGYCQLKLEKFKEAENSFKKAINLRPKLAKAHYNLGILYHQLVKLDEAVLCNQKAIQLDPEFALAHNNLGLTLQDQSKHEEAIACFKKAIQIKPDYAESHCNLIFCQDLSCHKSSDSFHEERAKWAKQHAEPLLKYCSTLNNTPDKQRVLRIGYIGADFNRHSAAYIFGPVLLNHDTDKFQIYIYAGNSKEDDFTNEFKKISTGYLSTIGIDDAQLADKIREDKIDILVDLAGHTKGNRLLVLARKPAPIQITAWGYPLGTSMSAMDYMFSDPVFIPLAKRDGFSEEIIDIPCVVHFNSYFDFPEVKAPAFIKNGFITFGAFNRTDKNTSELYKTWATILKKVANAKLFLKTVKLDSQENIDEVVRQFKQNGIDKNRLIILGKTPYKEHLKIHDKIDIMLDSFPHTGGVTTLESLRMGVPVLTCEKYITPSASASIIHAIGMEEWCCADDDEYIDKAIKFANDIEQLKTLRHSLRDRFDQSVLGNSQLYTKKIETIYQQIWKKWCDSKL
ncbi:MAG: tetratricopeptide repeat protein [Magnetococcales bacterium]|nr:tetratricopeptide repeat protein [Magnetococcales bacterium]